MKTLLIITGIILISFQIDRLLGSHLSGTSQNIEILSNFFSKDEPVPAFSTRITAPTTDIVSSKAIVAEEVVKTIELKKNKFEQKHNTGKSNKSLSKCSLHQALKVSGNYLELGTLQFGFNQYKKIDTKSFNTILQLADRLVFNDSLKISIAGFTDNKGDEAYNIYLSMLRVQNVKQYLLDLGVSDEQIIVSANGISNPIADNSTIVGRAANRRVEMMLIK